VKVLACLKRTDIKQVKQLFSFLCGRKKRSLSTFTACFRFNNVQQLFLQRKSHLCIPFLGVMRPQSHTFVCLWAIYIFPRSVSLFCRRKYVDQSWDYINRWQTHECIEIGAEKEYINGIFVAVYMRKGFLIYEEMSKYLTMHEEAVCHIWLCNCSTLNFLIYKENMIFFFISVRSGSIMRLCSAVKKPLMEELEDCGESRRCLIWTNTSCIREVGSFPYLCSQVQIM